MPMDRLSNVELIRMALKRRLFQIALLLFGAFAILSTAIHVARIKHGLEIPSVIAPLIPTAVGLGGLIEKRADSLVQRYYSLLLDSLPPGQHWRYQVSTVIYPETNQRSDVLTMLLRCPSCGPPIVRVVRCDLDAEREAPVVLSDESMYWGKFWHDFPQIRPSSGVRVDEIPF
jgi:hypothetical protein